MPMGIESDGVSAPIKTTREPVGPKRAGDKGSMGDRALMDAVVIVAAAWLILLILGFSLHRHNV